MKRLIICSDGTWNSPDQRFPTSVVRISHLIVPQAPDGTPQIVFYDRGVGTGNLLDRITGGLLVRASTRISRTRTGFS